MRVGYRSIAYTPTLTMTNIQHPPQVRYKRDERQFVRFRSSELPIDVEQVERKYNATFVGDFCVKGRNGDYVTTTAAVFWQETPPDPSYSNYFALIIQLGDLYITSGASAVEKPIDAVVAKDGEIVYSRHRHDYRTSGDGSVTVDGGRDYVRLIGDSSINAKRVQLVFDGPNIEVKEVLCTQNT